MSRLKRWQLAIIVALSVGFIVALYTVAEFGRARLSQAAADVQRAHEQWIRVVELEQILMDAEFGHRGYLLTGDPRHLAPLTAAVERIDALAGELAGVYQGRDARVAAIVQRLRSHAVDRLADMTDSVALYRSEGPAAALARSDSAAELQGMMRFHELAGITRDYEESLVERSLANWDRQLQVVGRLNLVTLLVALALTSLAIVAMSRSVRQRQEAGAELTRQHDRLQAQADAQSAELTELYRHLHHVQEEERARLSRGLHDELGGVLLAARMDVTWLQHNPAGPDDYGMRLDRIRTALDQGIDLKRRVVEELRPTLLDTMGLVAALRWQIEETCRRADLTVPSTVPGGRACLQPGRRDHPVPRGTGGASEHHQAFARQGGRYRARVHRPARRAHDRRRRRRFDPGGAHPSEDARHRGHASSRSRARRSPGHHDRAVWRDADPRPRAACERRAVDGRGCGGPGNVRHDPLDEARPGPRGVRKPGMRRGLRRAR